MLYLSYARGRTDAVDENMPGGTPTLVALRAGGTARRSGGRSWLLRSPRWVRRLATCLSRSTALPPRARLRFDAFRVVLCGEVWYGVVSCGMVWYAMVWYGVDMLWYGMGVVWYGCDVGWVWCGMVWYGRVWYGLVGCGMV